MSFRFLKIVLFADVLAAVCLQESALALPFPTATFCFALFRLIIVYLFLFLYFFLPRQVSTEAIDATVNLDNLKRSNYDPDEMMEEQRERGLRKRLNNAFKDFASKVQARLLFAA